MDKEIPKKEQHRESLRKWLKVAAAIAAVAVAVAVVMFLIGDSVSSADIRIHPATRGTLESSVAATGKIVPLREQEIVSPVATRIMEVYCNEGDSIGRGESLLRLDLQDAETDCRRAADEVSMKSNEMEQTALDNATYLTDLEMRVRVKEMAVSHLRAEMENERRLDSIGSGTGDRIRKAELSYATARMELQQLRTQLANERRSHAATYRSKQLEKSISARNLTSMQRTLDDARVTAPFAGTVTWLNKSLGASIAPGERLAVVSDLRHFKIEGEMPESDSGKLAVGSPVNIRINRRTIKGRIATVSPQSNNGMVSFTVFLDNDSDPLLRSGLRTEINVIYDVRPNVLRIPNGSYFQGPGNYTMFVRTAPDRLERRSVTLGESNFDFVEVISGISPGEEVAVSDMSRFNKRKSLKLK